MSPPEDISFGVWRAALAALTASVERSFVNPEPASPAKSIAQPSDFLILLVDDVASNLKVLQSMLAQAGYRLTFASGGQQALERVQTARPDLLLLDLMMPEFDGLQVASIMKHNPQWADIPIIFLTASHELNHLLQAFENGAVDYLTKPFKVPELLARVKTHLELRYLRQQVQRQAKQESMLRHLIEGIHRSLDLTDTLNRAVSDIQRFLDADRVMICRCHDPHAGHVVAIASNSERLDCPTTVSALPSTQPSAPVVRVSLSDRLPDADGHAVFLSDWQVKTELSLPIVLHDEVWGILMAHHCRQADVWNSGEADVLVQITQQLAIAIQQAELHQELQNANRDLACTVAKLKEANLELDRISNMDGLTQVPNRRYFDYYLQQEWLRMRREQQPLTLILGDIDYFKQYNDTCGHLAGDDVLRSVAQALAATLKRPADLIARYGGEEFAAILPNTTLQGGAEIAEQMRLSVMDLAIPHEASPLATPVLTISLGIASTVPTQMGSVDQLFAAVDRALYMAKAQGRNRQAIAPVD